MFKKFVCMLTHRLVTDCASIFRPAIVNFACSVAEGALGAEFCVSTSILAEPNRLYQSNDCLVDRA